MFHALRTSVVPSDTQHLLQIDEEWIDLKQRSEETIRAFQTRLNDTTQWVSNCYCTQGAMPPTEFMNAIRFLRGIHRGAYAPAFNDFFKDR